MKLIQYKYLLRFSILIGIGISCSDNTSSQEVQEDTIVDNERVIAQSSTTEIETASGIKYNFVRHGDGSVPPDGGYWTMNIAYFNEKGEKIFASTDQGAPLQIPYYSRNMLKNASLEECFSLLGKGDSAVFYISADSLYKNSAGGPTPPDLIGTKLKLSIGIEDVYTVSEYDSYKERQEKIQIDKEKELIEAYINEKGIDAESTSEGLYYEITRIGNGEMPREGQNVRVNYTGYLLDGTVFDTSEEAIAKEANTYIPGRKYSPYQFTLGTGAVIDGWDLGIALLSVGGKATLIIPSPLAYGNRGSGPLIKANTPLVFTVELVEIL